MSRNRPAELSSLVLIAIVCGWSSEIIAGDCPSDMVAVEAFCIDLYEAPNTAAGSPLVMYTFNEAEVWCKARGRRLCYDDEWTRACEGAFGLSYPYGNTHVPGLCNDDETWLSYNQTLLNQWPTSVSGPDVESFAGLLAAARAVSGSAADSADHVEALYQAEPAGSNAACISGDGVIDLCGNAEEWTRRRDGGTPGFSGNLKGRYWAESRTCQQNVTAHGDFYRFYEIGFRCCLDRENVFSDGFESGSASAWSVFVPRCGDLTWQQCMNSAECTFTSAYVCRPAEGPCESGFRQSIDSAESCEAKENCSYLPGYCFCPPGMVCFCGGGPPPGCWDS